MKQHNIYDIDDVWVGPYEEATKSDGWVESARDGKAKILLAIMEDWIAKEKLPVKGLLVPDNEDASTGVSGSCWWTISPKSDVVTNKIITRLTSC